MCTHIFSIGRFSKTTVGNENNHITADLPTDMSS